MRVIPEIETPGHARAAIKSMDARYKRLMKAGKKRKLSSIY
ncbi:family 20 glycosylhydrolase [Pedobacter steynii]